MSQRRYGRGDGASGGAGSSSEALDDVEQAELSEEMGRLSGNETRSIRRDGSGTLSSTGGSNAGGAGMTNSGGVRRASVVARIALVAIWLFIAATLTFSMLTSGDGIDRVERLSGSWGIKPDASKHAVGDQDPWIVGSGRQDLNFNTTFNPDDLTYTSDECDAFFPDLYKEIDRSTKYYSEKKDFDRTFLESTCDDGWWSHIRVVIYNNRLYIKYFKPAGFTRGESALALLHQSIKLSRERLPNIEFCIGLHDWASMGKFSLDRPPEMEDTWLMPDYSFWSWPEHVGQYIEMREKERKIDDKLGWTGKKNKLFWRGSMKVGTADREELMATAKGYDWNEMSEIVWGSPDKGPILMEDHCNYKFHAYPEGNTYSGRLRYLQNCATVIITHPQRWIQHYTHLFNGEWGHPDQNIVYIPKPLDDDPEKGVLVHDQDGKEAGRRRDWERLPEVMDKLLKDDALAQRIANNALRTFRDRYVVPATAPCYWRRSIRAFASIQKYDVQLDGTETTYENFLLQGVRNPDAPPA